MARPRSRARRSRYSLTARLSKSLPALLLVVFLLGVLLGASVAVSRTLSFLHTVTGHGAESVVNIVQNAVAPAPGSLAYKLQNNQQVNILVLGIGGAENDAPTLSDTMMVVTLDPSTGRVAETSVPRDLWVTIKAWTDGRTYDNKINVANEIGSDDSYSIFPCCKKPEFTGRDGGGHLAEDQLTKVTGVKFDRYVTVDFKAFRDVVDAVGGIDVVLDTPLDDCHYPDYHNGYVNHGVPPGVPCPPGAGIHFPAGGQHLDGERALELARSRDASEPEQATDFGRAKRQQAIVQAVKKKAVSANALTRLPDLMKAVESNVRTDMELSDMQAVYNWGAKVPDNSFVKVALTNLDLLDDFYEEAGSCGDPTAYVLCPLDPTYAYIKGYIGHELVDPRALQEAAPVQVVNASGFATDIAPRVTTSLRYLGLNLVDAPAARAAPAARTRIIDYSGGQYAQTASWLSSYLGAPVETPDLSSAGQPVAYVPRQQTTGLVVLLGRDVALRFYGRAP